MTIDLLEVDWPVSARVRACVSTRAGGVSGGSYASLNVGAHVGDRADAVTTNRCRLIGALALESEPHWLEQVHGTTVVELGVERSRHTADAAFTRCPGVVCCVQTADCLPVFLADRAGSVVGIAHAGWRGLAAGIIEATVAAMEVDPASLAAWLGPAISQAAFEVGAEVRDVCLAADSGAANAFATNPRGRWQANLYALAGRRLARAGVATVLGGGYCTFNETQRFFSHRRTAPCGRMASLIWLEPMTEAS